MIEKKQGLLRLALVIVAILGISVSAVAGTAHSLDSVLMHIGRDPEAISGYTTEDLKAGMNEDGIRKWCKLIISLKAQGITRKSIKQHYFPLCRSLVEAFFHESEIMQNLADGRKFNPVLMSHTDSTCTGRAILSRFMEYQRLCHSISMLPCENLTSRIYYGEMRLIEETIWGENKLMDRLDPIPDSLFTKVGALFDVKIASLESELPKLLQAYSNDVEFVMRNATLLMEAASYLSNYQMGMVIAVVSTVFFSQNKKQKIVELMRSAYEKKFGRDLFKKLWPIFEYKMTGIFESRRAGAFLNYRDSLLSKNVEYAKYYPHQCPERLKQCAEYDEYNERFYDLLDFIFRSLCEVSSAPNLDVDATFFKSVGCNSKTEFLRVYINETLRRYYDDDNFSMLGKIERIGAYIENITEYPVDLAMQIMGCFVPINAIKARDFSRNIGLVDWADKQMSAPKDSISDLGVRAVSMIVWMYAALQNEQRYPDILKRVEWVGNNIERSKADKDYVIFNIALALSLMHYHKESYEWISKVNVGRSEFRDDFNRLLLVECCALGRAKEALNVAKKIESFTYPYIGRYIQAKMISGKYDRIEELFDKFTASLSYDFNLFSLMNSDDQLWAFRSAKYRMEEILSDLDINLWIQEEMGDKNEAKFKPYIAAIYYNWALASKGALLRSNKYVTDLVINNMPPDDYRYFKQALAYESEDYDEGNATGRMIDAEVSTQAKAIILDYMRKDTTQVLPQFDYRIVRDQLQDGDIAIELISTGATYEAAMIRKGWEFPKSVVLFGDENEEEFWQRIDPYLAGVHRIYISLDGTFYFDNIELATDSAGIVMADKYEIYRVSTTLKIPRDIYITDIKNSAIYGNLKYADPYDEYIDSIGDGKRGAVRDMWIPLDDTKEEIDSISRILANAHITNRQYEGVKGDKASFVALSHGDVELLHLATHGFYNEEAVDKEDATSAMKRSGIVLSNSAYDLSYKKRSGTIFANEIANMDLNSVKLLVLSACETASGNLGDDGVFGLQRGFKQAGVGCIIMSLKEVNSVMTSELMQNFYSLFAKGQSVREALRNAQKQISKKYSIDDWKAFIVID